MSVKGDKFYMTQAKTDNYFKSCLRGENHRVITSINLGNYKNKKL